MSDNDVTRRGICGLCSQPITSKGKFGWYHDRPNMGAVHGVRGHFAHPAAA